MWWVGVMMVTSVVMYMCTLCLPQQAAVQFFTANFFASAIIVSYSLIKMSLFKMWHYLICLKSTTQTPPPPPSYNIH